MPYTSHNYVLSIPAVYVATPQPTLNESVSFAPDYLYFYVTIFLDLCLLN